MVSTISATATSEQAESAPGRAASGKAPIRCGSTCPAAIIFIVLFAIPTFASFYFSLTRWTLFDTEFIGLDNFVCSSTSRPWSVGFDQHLHLRLPHLGGEGRARPAARACCSPPRSSARGYLRSVVFFPVLVSTIGVGITFKILMDPFDGLVNKTLAVFGITGPGWLTDPNLALYSIVLVDIWKGVGIATLIFIAGMVAIPQEYYEAAKVDGASSWQIFFHITLPLVLPATATVILLSLIGGLRSFDLIWATTGGGPGFASDVIGSVIYKQYQAGFYGLSTAGNVMLVRVVTAIIVPVAISSTGGRCKR